MRTDVNLGGSGSDTYKAQLSEYCLKLAMSHENYVEVEIVASLKRDDFLILALYADCHNIGLFIDLLRFFNPDMRNNIIDHYVEFCGGLDFSEIDESRQVIVTGLLADMKFLRDNNHAANDSILSQPLQDQFNHYPYSATVAYARALELSEADDAEEAVCALNACLKLNPAYLPAHLLRFKLSNDTLASLDCRFQEVANIHPNALPLFALYFEKSMADASAKKEKRYEIAQKLIDCYDRSGDQDEKSAFKPLVDQARAYLVEHAPGRRACIKQFLSCDPEADNYQAVCQSIKNRFSSGDRVFAEEVTKLLSQNNSEDLMKAIRLCAANGKRTDVANLLLKNPSVTSCLMVGTRIGRYEKNDIMKLFREKVQTSIELTLNPPTSLFDKMFPVFSSKKKVPVLVMGEVKQLNNT